jgi:hypothetical protein
MAQGNLPVVNSAVRCFIDGICEPRSVGMDKRGEDVYTSSGRKE